MTLGVAARTEDRIQDKAGSARELDAAVRAGIDEVRYRNGIAVAWLRLVFRLATLALWVSNWPRAPLADQAHLATSIAVTSGHILVALGILLQLRARRWPDLTLAVAAGVDLFVVGFAGWSTSPGGGARAAYLMGVLFLMLLLSAVTLPRRWAALAGCAAIVWEFVLTRHLGLSGDFVSALTLTTAAFAAAVTWTGTRMVELAARRALGDYTAQLVRSHRDALAEANLRIAAQRDEVLAAQAQAETMSRLLVHDLKNPLSALQQFVALARSRLERAGAAGIVDPRLAEAVEDLRLAEGEGQRLTDMIGDLLLIVRLERATMAPQREAVPVHTLLVVVARGVQFRAEERGVALTVDAPPDLFASLDLDMVRRLLENLLANALRFVDRGGRVELAAAVEGDALLLAVRNTGQAVAPAARAELFQKHAPGAARRLHNAGLGLYLCRLVAEAHGGAIALVERPGFAAAFEARLPRGLPAAGALAG